MEPAAYVSTGGENNMIQAFSITAALGIAAMISVSGPAAAAITPVEAGTVTKVAIISPEPVAFRRIVPHGGFRGNRGFAHGRSFGGNRGFAGQRGRGRGLAPLIGGLGAGLLLGGALGGPDYGPGYDYEPGYAVAPPGGAVAYCMQRFQSYDPASGTYLGYDGMRHPCP
jgi:hypothetical protein